MADYDSDDPYGYGGGGNDYGYGDEGNTDYGYGDNNNMDYGYDVTDMGYGEAAPDQDYGYGDAKPDDAVAMGYGDAKPDDAAAMGYGDAAPDDPYGYGDAAPAPAPEKKRGPRRRCSITKYSLESNADKGGAEAEMINNINAANMLNNFRSGGAVQSLPNAQPPAALSPREVTPEQPPEEEESSMLDAIKDKSMLAKAKAADTGSDEGASDDGQPSIDKKKKTKLGRLRKRLSIF